MSMTKPKIIACDLDGTLFYPKQHKKYVSNKNIAFLRKFIDAGNRVVLVTSRSEPFVKKVIKEIERPVDYIASTGCKISVEGELIQHKFIDNEKLKVILDDVARDYNPLGLLVSSAKYPVLICSNRDVNRMIMSFYGKWYRFYFGFYREDFVYDNDIFDKEVKDGEVYGAKIFFGVRRKKNKISKEINKRLREKYPDIEASWAGIAIELTPSGCNKANSIETYIDYLHASPENVYVVGDSGNDISMFMKFNENSFVMSHAYPSVKKYAKHEISRVYQLDKYVFGKENNDE